MLKLTLLATSGALLLLLQSCANTKVPNEYPFVRCNPGVDQFGNAVNCVPSPSADHRLGKLSESSIVPCS